MSRISDPIGLLRIFADSAREPILVLGHDLRVRLANSPFGEAFGIEPGGAEGKLVYDLGEGRWDIQCLRSLLEGVLPVVDRRDGFVIEHDFGPVGRMSLRVNARKIVESDHPDGLILLAFEIVASSMDPSRELVEDQWLFADVARSVGDRKRARSEFVEDENRRRTIMNAVPALICYLDRDLRYRLANESYREWFGHDPESIIGKTVAEALGEEVADTLAPFMQRALSGEVQTFEQKIPHIEHGSRTVQLTYTPDRDESGRVVGLVILASDISDRKALEESLRAGEERWRRLFDGMAEGFFVGEIVHDPGTGRARDVRFLELNPAFGTLTGLPVAETIGRTMREAIPGIQEDLIRIYAQVAATGESYRFEVFIPALGDRWYEARARHVGGDRVSVLFMDITDRKAAEAAVRASEERFRQLADAMPQIVFMARPDGHVDYFNRRWYEYTGLPDDGRTGDASWASVHEPGCLQRVILVWNESLRTGRPYEIEYRLRRADGEFRWHLGRALPVRDASGEITRWFGTNTDIDDQKRAEQALVEARNTAQAANRMKDEFLAVLSHELRTPLNAIVGWSKILRSGDVDADDLAEGLAAIERNGQVQSQLIEDLLDISRIVSGNLRLDVQRVDLIEVIDAALEAVAPAAASKSIRVIKEVAPHIGDVSGDPARLQQVAWNLVTNAVKFTPRGGEVRVWLGLVSERAELRIQDTGIGIGLDFLPFVFHRFRQADASTTRRHGGLGLGLSIVKQLVEMHGGTIRAESPGEGQGATFIVRLPIISTPAGPPGDESASPGRRREGGEVGPEADLAGLRVLVVDDDPDARHLLRRALTSGGAVVATASSVDEALGLLGRFRPEVLVSDIGMPERDGYDLIRAVRASHTSKQMPAAALTAFARAEDRKKALLAGFQTHIAKPVDPAELTVVVASLAGRTGQGLSPGKDHP